MAIITKDASLKENKGNALLIGAAAREAKKKDPSVIDSTIGMLFDEEGKFYTFKTVEKAVKNLSGKEKYSYGGSSGSKEYHDALYHWVFREYYDEILNNNEVRCVSSPGGTGAICNVFSNYLDEGDKVLLPNYMWTNYTQLAREEHLSYDTYNMFKEDGTFDIENVKEKCLEMKNKQGRVMLLINDPCQNPTGYSLTYEEWISVVEILNSISKDGTPTILLYDMAYIDYDIRGFEASRKNIRLFQNLGENVLTVLCFSGSKTLGLYGLRIGAAICMTKTKEAADNFFTALDFSARGKWSAASTLGENIIIKVLTEYKDEFAKEIDFARKLLIDRAKLFISEAKRVGLETLPYSCGFFVSILNDNPQKAYEALKEKGLHILPIPNAIRITLSSITLDEVKRTVKIIKETLN